MTYIIIALAVIISFALGAFIGVKSVQLGLKYQMQIQKGVEPTLSPIRDVIDDITSTQNAKQANNETAEMIGDILGGL